MAISIDWWMEKTAKPPIPPSVEMMRTMRHIVTFRLFVCLIQLQLLRRCRRRFVLHENVRSLCSHHSVCVCVCVCIRWGIVWQNLDRIRLNAVHHRILPSVFVIILLMAGAIAIRTKIRFCYSVSCTKLIWHYFCGKRKWWNFTYEREMSIQRNNVASMLPPAINHRNQCIRRMREAYSKRRNVSLFRSVVSRRRNEKKRKEHEIRWFLSETCFHILHAGMWLHGSVWVPAQCARRLVYIYARSGGMDLSTHPHVPDTCKMPTTYVSHRIIQSREIRLCYLARHLS